jgi:glycosyltransferase involved in cell wall biosynthesis
MAIHCSNLRPVKRIDLLLQTVACASPAKPFKLVILAGADFTPFMADVRRLGLEDKIIVRENILDIEDYLQAADLGLYTSDNESFCLSILEAMCFGCPSIARHVGGIPEVVEDNLTGILTPADDPAALAQSFANLVNDSKLRVRLGVAAKARAEKEFSADAIVPRYEALYRGVVR